MFAYTGKILHIDLTNKTTKIQRVGEDFLKKYVGGVCMAARLAYDNIPKGADPLGPDNALCFAMPPSSLWETSTAWPPNRPSPAFWATVCPPAISPPP